MNMLIPENAFKQKTEHKKFEFNIGLWKKMFLICDQKISLLRTLRWFQSEDSTNILPRADHVSMYVLYRDRTTNWWDDDLYETRLTGQFRRAISMSRVDFKATQNWSLLWVKKQ